jgi:quinol monooxygenase YgiN
MKRNINGSLLFSVFCSALFLCSCASSVKEKAAVEEETVAMTKAFVSLFTNKKAAVEEENVAVEEVNRAEALTIVANVTVYPEFRDEILPAIEAVVEGTRKEEGNISYDVFEDTANPLRFTFIETWKSQAAIDSHNASAHFVEFAKALENKANLEAFILKQKY